MLGPRPMCDHIVTMVTRVSSFRLTDGNEYLFQAKDEVSSDLSVERNLFILPSLYSLLWCPLQDEMSTWIQAILNANADRSDAQDSKPGTPVSGRAQTLPATVTLATESSPGKREKDKEKRFSLFGKKKQL